MSALRHGGFLLLGLVGVLLVTTSGYAYGLLTGQNTLSSSGVVASANIGVYSDQACTQSLTSISWGTCYPSSNATAVIYVKNLGTVNEALTVQAANWSPSTASTYLTLTSDYSGQSLTPGQVLKVTFTLRVSSGITGITSFSFNVVLTSQG
jgi:archaellum component FlaG (FlaF/FlaG flagellin family)